MCDRTSDPSMHDTHADHEEPLEGCDDCAEAVADAYRASY